MFIDDNAADRQLAVLALARDIPEARIQHVSTALEFSSALAEGEFDITIAEARLSWSDGPSLIRTLKAKHPGRPVILFTSRLEQRLEIEAFQAGPADFVMKSSAGFLTLGEAVRNALARFRLRAERELSEGRLKALMDRSQLGVFRADWSGRLLEVNAALAEMLGARSSAEALNSSLPSLFFSAASPEDLQARIEKHGTSHKHEFGLARPDGGSRWVCVNETVSFDSLGGAFIEGVVEDATASRARQQELSRSNQDLQNFAYVASHELQEPIRTIERYTKILAEEHLSRLGSDGAECVRFAHEGARRMQDLVESLLAFARIDSQGGTFEECEASELVERAVQNLRATVEEKRAVVTWSGLPRIRADGRQLVQLFQNLISNALKFQRIASSPTVRIAAERQDGHHLFAVRDNGIGIESGHLENIFDLFKRLNPSYPGSGLGLAICRRIVQRHGGKIWVESEVGKGSAFFFQIPVSPDV